MMPEVTSRDNDYQAGDISSFPSVIDERSALFSAANEAETTLVAGISWKSASLTIADASKFPMSDGVVRVDDELIYYATRNGNILSDLVRGAFGTSVANHAMDSIVSAPCIADMMNGPRDAVLQVQRKTGLPGDAPAIDDQATLWARANYLRRKWFTPTIIFFAFNQIGYSPLGVQFSDLSRGEPVRWLWEFGDGEISSEQNPYHVYTSPGTYDVSLTIYASSQFPAYGGVASKKKKGYVTVLDNEEINNVMFYVRNLSGSAGREGISLQGRRPLRMLFVDQTRGNVQTRIWTFGDGTTATVNDPNQFTIEHSYERVGRFVPQLTVSDGKKTLRKTLDAKIEVVVG